MMPAELPDNVEDPSGPPLQKPVSREIFALYLRIQALAQAAFAELPPEMRGTLRCAISDARFTLPMWDQEIQDQPIEAAFILIRREAGMLAGQFGPNADPEKLMEQAIERAKEEATVREAIAAPPENKPGRQRIQRNRVLQVLDMLGDTVASLSDAPPPVKPG